MKKARAKQMDAVRVFMITPTDLDLRSLRRYSSESCPALGYHNAMVTMGEVPHTNEGIGDLGPRHAWLLSDAWPIACACGYRFRDTDPWQDFREQLYRRSDNGELVTLRSPPPGACWDAEWLHDRQSHCGPDGRSLHVVCPDGRIWNIDGRARNCTMKDDQVHKCWVRHGSPEAGDLTVDKRGVTCAAGAGSIDTGTYHGFLRNGEFVPA